MTEHPQPQPPRYYDETQVEDLIQRALEQHTQVSGGFANAHDVQIAINEALARQQQTYEPMLAGLRQQIDALRGAGAEAPTVPAHAGGPFLLIAETWSQWEQERSRQSANADTQRMLDELAAAGQ